MDTLTKAHASRVSSGVPWRVTSYESTPNPGAYKCMLDAPVIVGSHPFRRDKPLPLQPDADANRARAQKIAELLFEHPNIQGVLICHDWITINRADKAPWPPIKKHLEQVLQQLEPLEQASS